MRDALHQRAGAIADADDGDVDARWIGQAHSAASCIGRAGA
jgi:hypothetical protein